MISGCSLTYLCDFIYALISEFIADLWLLISSTGLLDLLDFASSSMGWLDFFDLASSSLMDRLLPATDFWEAFSTSSTDSILADTGSSFTLVFTDSARSWGGMTVAGSLAFNCSLSLIDF